MLWCRFLKQDVAARLDLLLTVFLVNETTFTDDSYKLQCKCCLVSLLCICDSVAPPHRNDTYSVYIKHSAV